MDLDNSIEKTLSQIQKLMNTNSIVGNPISTKDRVIIPISKAALGFGVGVGNKSGKDNDSNVGGAGGGGSIDPVALVIIYNDIPGPDGVELLPLNNMDTPLEDLLTGVGKALYDFFGNKSSEKSSVDTGNIEKIKTKIKPKTGDKTPSKKSTKKE